MVEEIKGSDETSLQGDMYDFYLLRMEFVPIPNYLDM
jgi:hypothetical protein